MIQLLEPGVESLGFELLDVEYTQVGARNTLRIYIDRADGITVDDCGVVSRHVSATLDVEDPINEPYDLEVSSPGEKRPLRTPAHFLKAVGERARVEMGVGLAGRRRFTGIIEGVENDMVNLDVDHEPFSLPLVDVVRAHIAPRTK
ncbi:MAG: ribosome maturation factor RimP [Pseudomonadota bacterium]